MVGFTPRPLYPGERVSDTHWIGGWVGPWVGLDDVVGKKNLASTDHSAIQPLAICYTDGTIPAHNNNNNNNNNNKLIRIVEKFNS
jgi:hypothetical protein